MRIGSSVRSAGSVVLDLTETGRCWTSTSSFLPSACSSGSSWAATSTSSSRSVSTTWTPISLNFARRSSICSDLTSAEESNAFLVVSDVAARLGAVEQVHDGRVGKVERWALRTLFLQFLFVLRRHLDLACRETSESSPVPRLEARCARRAASSGGPRNHSRLHRQQTLTL